MKAGAGRLSMGAGQLKESGMMAGSVAAEKAKNLKEQLIKKEMGTKIMSFFTGSKKSTSKPEESQEEFKEGDK